MSNAAVAWGDVPTWLGSITTALALVAASWVVSIELRRNREAQHEKRAEQARLIAGWTDDDQSSGATLRNGSSLPVYDVDVHVISVSECWQADFDPKKRARGSYKAHLAVLPPGDTRVSEAREDGERTATGRPPKPYRLRISFTDARGNRWTRDEGSLIELLNDRTEVQLDS